MCPPLSVRYQQEDVSYLRESWVYQLQHGPPMQLCFLCFKAAFLDLKELLELEAWGDEDWDLDFMDYVDPGPEQGDSPGPGPSWGQGQAAESEGLGQNFNFVPTELTPQEVVPLELDPEDTDWTQGLPWRIEKSHLCPHWLNHPVLWHGFLKTDLPPGEPIVLQLGCTQTLDPAQAQDRLLCLQFITIVGCLDSIYFRRMVPCRALQMPDQGWEVLLEPKEVWVVRLQDALQQQQKLQQWKLSVLEPSAFGPHDELVPADLALQKRGFTLLSHSPLDQSDPEPGPSESRLLSAAEGQELGTLELWVSGPMGPVMETSALAEASSVQDFSRGCEPRE
ncbi:PREDICTED: testis-expressed protein 19.2-like [Chrysochloris asiatica]|uniref:Testis-expressed protein 19.2-like n=1 Tax=Chrysochloris asiatica TaxID=185453 RepID=A0A9B0WV39_CHRAS|nr:PREDICTED: testis-expressed protein 19.2-like [Chrysochloris asiatica]